MQRYQSKGILDLLVTVHVGNQGDALQETGQTVAQFFGIELLGCFPKREDILPTLVGTVIATLDVPAQARVLQHLVDQLDDADLGATLDQLLDHSSEIGDCVGGAVGQRDGTRFVGGPSRGDALHRGN